MLADGLFDRFPCDTVYGLHNRPGLPVGQFAIRPGPIMAGAIFFDIMIQGKGGHGARPEQTIDPVVVGAQIVTALQTVVARNVPALDSAVLSVTGFNAGQAYNVIPDQVTLKGTVRAFKMEMMRLVEDRMRAVVNGTAAAFGASAEITFKEIAAPTINAPEEATALGDAAASLVGETAVERNRTPVMGSEDFAYMLLQRPGAYIHVGNGTGDAGGCDVHNPHYDFNDEAIPYGGGVMAALVEQKLPRVK
jgi:hippurate hydrolase